jgi:hypothetical protein
MPDASTMAAGRVQFARDEIWLLKVIMKRCTLENLFMYAAAITCTATSECHYAFANCQDQDNYDDGTFTFQFCNRGADMRAFSEPTFPYLKAVEKVVPTEINPKKFTTSRGTMEFELVNDTAHVLSDPDKLFDAGKASNKTDTGNYLWNWIKRNPAYRGRIVELYYGFKGVDQANFELKFRGIMDDISQTPRTMKIKCMDLLWANVQADMPRKIPTDLTVDAALTTASTTILLDYNGVTNFTASDHFETPDADSASSTVNQYRYVKIGNEIIGYSGITDGAGAALTGCVRALMGTAATAHAVGSEIKQVNYYAEDDAESSWANHDGIPADHAFMDMIFNLGGVNPTYVETHTTNIATQIDGNQLATATTITVSDIADLPGEGIVLVDSAELIRYTGISGATLTGCKRGCYGTTPQALSDNDTVYPTTFTHWLGNHMQGFRYRARFESSKKAKERINSLRLNTMMDVWVNESGNVEGRLTVPPAFLATAPSEFVLDDFADEGKRKIDRNEKMRITRTHIFFNPQSPDPGNNASAYEGGDRRMYIDTVAESSDSFNEVREQKIYAEWIYRFNEANIWAARNFMINREVRHILEFTLEIKDEALKTGDLCEITIPEIVTVEGAQDQRVFKIIKKLFKRMGKAIYKAMDTGFGDKRYCLISDAASDYDATSKDKNIYGWISDGNNKVGAANDEGYNIF